MQTHFHKLHKFYKKDYYYIDEYNKLYAIRTIDFFFSTNNCSVVFFNTFLSTIILLIKYSETIKSLIQNYTG